MADLSRAFSEAKSLPDEALQREIATPSGMLPPYIALGELSERRAIRAGGTPGQKPTIMQQIMMGQQPQTTSPDIPSFAGGGAVMFKAAESELMKMLNQASGGLSAPNGLQALGPPGIPKPLSEMELRELQAPLPSAYTGISSLLR